MIEREREAGGIPRHSDHTGFGLRDLRTVLSGPRYAERYRELAAEAGVEVLAETMVTDWEGERALKLTGPAGRRELEPPAVVLATGCRERPRSARLVPGSRPAGRDDHRDAAAARPPARPEGRPAGGDRRRRARQLLGGGDPGARRGARSPAWSRSCPRHQSLAAFRAGAAVRYRAPVWSRTAVSAIHGAERVESVELTELDSGRTRIGRLRPGRLHRRLDPRPRARGDGRLRARSGLARPARRPGAAHDPPRRVRGREPAAPGRDRRRLRARRPPRRAGGRRLPARARGVAGPASGSWPASRWPGSRPNLLLGDRPRPAARPLPAALARVRPPRADPGPPGRARSSGAAGSAAWFPGARPTSRPGGPPRVDPERGPGDRRRWNRVRRHERRDVARHRRGDDRASRPRSSTSACSRSPRRGATRSTAIRRRAGSSRTARR